MVESLLFFTCCNCGNLASACPDCVLTVLIDPETGLPPDVQMIGGHAIRKEMDPIAVQRSMKQPVCDACVERRNRKRADVPPELTSTERHRMHV